MTKHTSGKRGEGGHRYISLSSLSILGYLVYRWREEGGGVAFEMNLKDK